MALFKSPALRLESIPSFRPKSGLYVVRRQGIRSIVSPRAAEADTVIVKGSDFQFNYDDAKKNNEYSLSDVDAALKYYYNRKGVPPVHDAVFVTNHEGTDDAKYFDDIEDISVWEEDEYQATGIPEAAPDTRSRGRRGQGSHYNAHAEKGRTKLSDNLTIEQDAYNSAEQDKLWEWLNGDNQDLTVGEELLQAALVGGSLKAGADAGVQGQAEAVEEGAMQGPSLMGPWPAVNDEPAFAKIIAQGEDDQDFQHRVLEVRRVTKVVKGGRIMGFRCVAAVGNGVGVVGAGCGGGREVSMAVKRAVVDARKKLIRIPMVGDHRTIPHRVEAKFHAGRVLLMPAGAGTGIVAGGVMRAVLELAGIKNCVAKRLGSRSPLNTVRATIKAMQGLKTLRQVAEYRGLPVSELGKEGIKLIKKHE